jgi:hypothetical protein
LYFLDYWETNIMAESKQTIYTLLSKLGIDPSDAEMQQRGITIDAVLGDGEGDLGFAYFLDPSDRAAMIMSIDFLAALYAASLQSQYGDDFDYKMVGQCSIADVAKGSIFTPSCRQISDDSGERVAVLKVAATVFTVEEMKEAAKTSQVVLKPAIKTFAIKLQDGSDATRSEVGFDLSRSISGENDDSPAISISVFLPFSLSLPAGCSSAQREEIFAEAAIAASKGISTQEFLAYVSGTDGELLPGLDSLIPGAYLISSVEKREVKKKDGGTFSQLRLALEKGGETFIVEESPNLKIFAPISGAMSLVYLQEVGRTLTLNLRSVARPSGAEGKRVIEGSITTSTPLVELRKKFFQNAAAPKAIGGSEKKAISGSAKKKAAETMTVEAQAEAAPF